MSYLYDALRKIEALTLLVTMPWTEREAQIYSIACAALNLADGEAAEMLKKFRCKDCLVEWIGAGEKSKCYSCGCESTDYDDIRLVGLEE